VDQSVVAIGVTRLTVPAITQDIVDEGTVLIYVRNTGTTTQWYALPYSDNSGHTIDLSDFGVGYVDLQANFAQANAFDFRIVVISGTGLTQLNVANPGINLRNYNEVANALHLSN
jgi:hypothetical protein